MENSQNHDEISTEDRIKIELSRIGYFFENLEENKMAIISPLLQNAAFMRITLEDLQRQIIDEGVTEAYQNGEHQKGMKQSAALQSYNSLVKNYANVVKTLSQYLPVKHTSSYNSPMRLLDGYTTEQLEEKIAEKKEYEARHQEYLEEQRRKIAEMSRGSSTTS